MSTDGENEDVFQMDEDFEVDASKTIGMADHNNVNGDSSPVPPPHKAPSPPPKPAFDPEACKALGNKYFKAKDYTKAVQEYTKGTKALAEAFFLRSLSVPPCGIFADFFSPEC